MLGNSKYYNNNENLKKAGVVQKMTPEEQLEYIRCMEDIIYFCEKYVKVLSLDHGMINFKPYEYQKRFINELKNSRHVISMQPRQSGKSATCALFILHSLIFNKDYTAAILANKGDQAQEIMFRLQTMYEALPWFLQPGVKVWNKRRIELGNGSICFTSATSGSAVRGRSINCVTGDTKVTWMDDLGHIFHTRIDHVPYVNSTSSKYIEIDEGKTMYYTVYKITNKINGKIYVGYHATKNLDDGYMGSGKVIMRAVEKYGVEALHKEYLHICDNKEEAEFLESLIVDEKFTLREDTYNINLGGNVRVSVGRNNGFYGKKHTKETIERITAKTRGMVTGTGNAFYFDGVYYPSVYKFQEKHGTGFTGFRRWFEEGRLVWESSERQQKWTKWREVVRRNKEEARIKSSERMKAFASLPRTEEWKEKIGAAHRGQVKPWVVEKINRNPEKIKKTADKHRGMKRSDQTKKNISESLKNVYKNKNVCNKGKVYAYDPESLDKKSFMFDNVESIPEGWVKGVYASKGRKKGKIWCNDGNGTLKLVDKDAVPEGWKIGRK